MPVDATIERALAEDLLVDAAIDSLSERLRILALRVKRRRRAEEARYALEEVRWMLKKEEYSSQLDELNSGVLDMPSIGPCKVVCTSPFGSEGGLESLSPVRLLAPSRNSPEIASRSPGDLPDGNWARDSHAPVSTQPEVFIISTSETGDITRPLTCGGHEEIESISLGFGIRIDAPHQDAGKTFFHLSGRKRASNGADAHMAFLTQYKIARSEIPDSYVFDQDRNPLDIDEPSFTYQTEIEPMDRQDQDNREQGIIFESKGCFKKFCDEMLYSSQTVSPCLFEHIPEEWLEEVRVFERLCQAKIEIDESATDLLLGRISQSDFAEICEPILSEFDNDGTMNQQALETISSLLLKFQECIVEMQVAKTESQAAWQDRIERSDVLAFRSSKPR